MKKVVWTLGDAGADQRHGLGPGCERTGADRAGASSATAPAHSALDRALIANERKLTDALMKKDKAGVHRAGHAGRRRVDAMARA